MIATVERTTAPKAAKRRATAEAGGTLGDLTAEQIAASVRKHEAMLAEVRRQVLAFIGASPARHFEADDVAEAIQPPKARRFVDEMLLRLAEEGAIDAQISARRWTYHASAGAVVALSLATPRADALTFLTLLWGCSEDEARERAVRGMAAYYRAMTEDAHA